MIGCYHIENITISQCRIISFDSFVITNNYDVMFGQTLHSKQNELCV